MSDAIKKPVKISMLAIGVLITLWATAALLSGLHQVNWQVTTFMRHMLMTSGLIDPLHTMVDFYTHIKGVEYIICVMFFIVFPLYFRYVEKSHANRKTAVKTMERS